MKGESLTLPFSGATPISRHHSAKAAAEASKTRATKTLQYLALLDRIGKVGVTDHDSARMLGLPLSSICSIRNGCADLVIPAATSGTSPYGRTVTKWRRA